MPALTITFGSNQYRVFAEDAFIIEALRKRRAEVKDLALYIDACE